MKKKKTEKGYYSNWKEIYFTYIALLIKYISSVHTYANASRDRRLTDPERDPGQNHKGTGWHICLQNEVKDASLQLEVKDQFGVPA